MGEDYEVVIRLDMDGFRATIDPDSWLACSEYRLCEIDHDENEQPLNIDVWEGVEFYQNMEQQS